MPVSEENSVLYVKDCAECRVLQVFRNLYMCAVEITTNLLQGFFLLKRLDISILFCPLSFSKSCTITKWNLRLKIRCPNCNTSKWGKTSKGKSKFAKSITFVVFTFRGPFPSWSSLIRHYAQCPRYRSHLFMALGLIPKRWMAVFSSFK